MHDLEHAAALDRGGHYREAAELLDVILGDTGSDALDGDTIARALALRASLFRYEGLLDRADGVVRLGRTQEGLDAVARCDLEVEAARIELERSNLDAAEARSRAAADIASEIPDGPDRLLALARSNGALAACHRIRGGYAEAQALLTDVIASLEVAAASGPPDGPATSELAHALVELGVLYKFSGAFNASQANYEQAAAILTESWGPDHPDLGSIFHNLGGLAHARGDLVPAEDFARRSVEVHERALGPDHLATVLDRSALATILDELGRSDEAEAILIDCAARLEAKVGPEHRELAVALNNLAAIAMRQGRLEEAEEIYRRTLGIKERSIGPDSPSMAITLNNLATVKRRQGRLEDAAALYERAIDILVRAAGPSHPHVAVMRRNLQRVREGPPEVSGS